MVIIDHFYLGLETLAFQSMLYPETVEVGINKLQCVMAASLCTHRVGYLAFRACPWQML